MDNKADRKTVHKKNPQASSKHFTLFQTVSLRPKATDSWDGPHFRLHQCGVDYSREAWAPHALFMDAIDPEGTWLYVLSGVLYYKIGGERRRVEAGQALVTRHPDPGWLVRPSGTQPLHTLWLNVTGEESLRFFDYLHIKYGQIQNIPPKSEPVRLAKKLIRLVAAEPGRPAFFWSAKTFQWLNAWWQCLHEHHPRVERVLMNATPSSRLISYGPKTFKKFASEMGYSRAYLTRKLSDQWNRSPGKVLREARLEEAARLLRTTRLSIYEIAEKVGYSAVASLSRAFVRQFKQTPRDYRRFHQ